MERRHLPAVAAPAELGADELWDAYLVKLAEPLGDRYVIGQSSPPE